MYAFCLHFCAPNSINRDWKTTCGLSAADSTTVGRQNVSVTFVDDQVGQVLRLVAGVDADRGTADGEYRSHMLFQSLPDAATSDVKELSSGQTDELSVTLIPVVGITIPVIVSSPDTKLPMKKPPYLPATFIIGPDGKVIDTIMGELTAAHLKQRLETLKGANE